MMIVNYVFVISILPACIALFETHLKFNWWRPLQLKIREWPASAADFFFSDIAPFIITWLRFPLVILGIVLFGLAVRCVCWSPGIRLPQHNSMQVTQFHPAV
ncbi:hypothetical protein AB6A40_010994 [Gnathostoma spinigerum]|uniref:Uncharacterized protein n=1 Tax=Gnathostoma spinigerum TaxID=75299 RepID=A0ABD6F464_9BILA